MKARHLLLLSVLAAGFLRAQADTNTNVPPPPPPPPHEGGNRGGFGGLSQADRDELKTAREKALAANPSLQQNIDAARKALDDAQKALHDAMVQADSGVAAIFAKMPPRHGGPGGPGAPGKE